MDVSLPPAPLESAPLFEEEMDARTELCAAIQHVVTEQVGPAVETLRAAAESRKEEA